MTAYKGALSTSHQGLQFSISDDKISEHLIKGNRPNIILPNNQSFNQNPISPISREEDYIGIEFRHLSETIVGAGTWKATDFTKKGVLKKGAEHFTYKPVYQNHYLEIGNQVATNGIIKYVPEKNGVPGGLEGPIFVDSVQRPGLLRDLTAWPVPLIQSVSVTVYFDWEPSHEFKTNGEFDLWEFYERLGTTIDGEMVRRIVTKITSGVETSFVYMGADPFAKIKQGDELLNIDYDNVISASMPDKWKEYNFMKDNSHFFHLEKYEKPILNNNSNSLNYSKTGKNNNNQNKNNMELKKILSEKFGVTPDEITEDFLKSCEFIKQGNVQVEKTSFEAMKTQSQEFIQLKEKTEKDEEIINQFSKIYDKEKLNELDEELGLANIVDFAKNGKQELDDVRKEAVRFYKIKAGDKVSDLIVGQIEKSDLKLAKDFYEQYSGEAYGEIKPTCSKCGSQELNFRKSTPDGEGNGGNNDNTGYDFMEDHARFIHK